jgi:hypothetical protein
MATRERVKNAIGASCHRGVLVIRRLVCWLRGPRPQVWRCGTSPSGSRRETLEGGANSHGANRRCSLDRYDADSRRNLTTHQKAAFRDCFVSVRLQWGGRVTRLTFENGKAKVTSWPF